MPLISLTRLRLASPRYLPGFAWYALRSISQARRSPGFRGGPSPAQIARAWPAPRTRSKG